jgi:hypothetical protein
MKPWTKHTRQPITETEHTVLRRALTEPAAHPRWEPFRLRNLALVELFWDTGVHSESLTHADTTDLGPDLADIRLTVNPPGRTAATVQRFPLSPNTRAALRLWLPVRRAVITRHLSAGPDAPANQALFIILAPTTVDQPDGTYRVIPPGIRISGTGLELSYASWARRLNAEHHGQPGWPVPTTFQQLARGGAIAQGHIPDGTPKGRRWALTAEQVAEAAQRRAAGQALVSIAAGFGVNRQTLHSALKRYGHLS